MSRRMILKAFRVEPDLWRKAQEKCSREATSVSAVLRQALRSYVRTKEKKGRANEK
jgi:predicted transcriptional regulator